MPAAKRPATTSSRRIVDVPRAGYICASYSNGHNVHYEPVAKSAPSLTPKAARLELMDSGLALKIGCKRIPVFSHNPDAFWSLVTDFGSDCEWYPTLNLVCWLRPQERHWASLSLGPVSSCFSSEEAAKAEWDHWMS